MHPSAWKWNSANFAKNNVLEDTKFIANSPPLARVVTLYNFKRG
jgi:hypothetical protein